MLAFSGILRCSQGTRIWFILPECSAIPVSKSIVVGVDHGIFSQTEGGPVIVTSWLIWRGSCWSKVPAVPGLHPICSLYPKFGIVKPMHWRIHYENDNSNLSVTKQKMTNQSSASLLLNRQNGLNWIVICRFFRKNRQFPKPLHHKGFEHNLYHKNCRFYFQILPEQCRRSLDGRGIVNCPMM